MFNKNVIEYQFAEAIYNEKHIAKEIIKNIIVKATPTSSCWWSKLKSRTDNAKDELFGKKKAQERLLNNEPSDDVIGTTAKTCSGILNLFSKTYLIKSPTDIVITIDSKENYSWDVASKELATIESHKKRQFWNEGNDLFKEKACFKIVLKIRLKTNGFGYMLSEPFYHDTLNARFALGYVSSVYAQSEQLNLFIFIDIPKEGTKSVIITKGTVLQYLIPDVKSRLVLGKKRFLADLLDTGFSKKRKS